MSATYDVGTKAWQPDPTEGWVASEVEQKIVDGDKVKLVFVLANGEVSFSPLPLTYIDEMAETDHRAMYRPGRPRRRLLRSRKTAMQTCRR